MTLPAVLAPTLPTLPPATAGGPASVGAAPASDAGRAFRALLGRQPGPPSPPGSAGSQGHPDPAKAHASPGEAGAGPASTEGTAPATPHGKAAGHGDAPAGRSGPLDRADRRDDPGAVLPVDPSAPGSESTATASGDPRATDDDTLPVLDPALQHLLQPATLPPQAAPRALEATGRSAAPADDDAAGRPGHAGAGDARRPGTPAWHAQGAAAAAQRAEIAAPNDGTANRTQPGAPAAADIASFAARLSEARGGADPRAAVELASTPVANLPLTAATAPPPVATPLVAAPAATATLVAAPDSAAFPGEFGVQIATFAQDGIEHAELHLNPAEMGPVAVQIALDGTQARVELRADLAATRDALQQSLPALAAALREAGLTLAGGSVSAQAGQGGASGRGQGGGDERGTPRGDALDPRGELAAASAPATLRRTARLGGVDLYA